MPRLFQRVCFALLLVLIWPSASALACRDRLVVVYWSATDCSWCRRWEADPSQGAGFRRSAVFNRLTFVTVKKPLLAQPYSVADYPENARWVQQKVVAGEIKTPTVVPAWTVFVDRRPIDTYYGTQGWVSRAADEIGLLVREVCR